ncbi:LpqB family beta-propeller domain-containing protein [Corynebacterium sp. LK2510]|uniref:LpqB family beta-propeller domain-containing protein n=1 Tax=Corynebacterium sp. LK2510 TaxID=3110472 RepID=UPI0034CF027C
MPMNKNSKPAVAAGVAASLAAVVALSACATLPSNTAPHVIRAYESQETADPKIAPQAGSEPDLLLRDFFAASAIPTSNYEAARSFLTAPAQAAWQPSETILVVDRLSLSTVAGGTDGRRSFSVQGGVIGEIHPGGVFRPNRALYDSTMELEQVNGEWRISSLPSGVVIERADLRDKYQPHNLYFFDNTGTELVADRRWLYNSRGSLDSELLTVLMDGPAERLKPAVRFDLAEVGSYVGYDDGAYNFSGFGSVSEERRFRFAAQVVWVLAEAGVTGPIAITADGDPLVPGFETFSTEDFPDLAPVATAPGDVSTFALSNGNLYSVSEGETEPVQGALGGSGTIASADLARGGNYAVVTGSEGGQRFEIGSLGGFRDVVVEGESFTRPSFEPDASAVWVVADGERVLRTVRSAASGAVSTTEIPMQFPDGVEGNISVLRLSRTGTRAVLVIEGRLFTGIVEQNGLGEQSIVNILEYVPDLGGSVIAADWNPDGSLLVGTSVPETPIVRVEQDGSSMTVLPGGNLTAPVVAVASTPTMNYATDANGTLQLPAIGVDERPNWREVPGLQGIRAVPIIAR